MRPNSARCHLFVALLSCICITAFGLFPRDACADQEGRMPLTQVRLDSKGLDNSGPVHIETTQSARGMVELTVSAFGKLYALKPAELATLSGVSFNSIGLTYSQGYPNTEGRNVFVLLCQAFSSGAKVVAVVTVTETGGIRVTPGR